MGNRRNRHRRQGFAKHLLIRAVFFCAGLLGMLVVPGGSISANNPHRDYNSEPNPGREALERRQELARTALARLESLDTFAAIEVLAGYNDSLVATHAFALVARDLYWRQKDLPGAVAIARGGVQFGLTAALDIEPRNKDLATMLRSAAKAIAYDLASFTWSGWKEEGIEIGPGELAIGLDAAKTNLRLVKTLKKGDTPLGRAYWILGAHRLAQHEFDIARKRFGRAAEHFEYAGNRPERLLSLGFVAVADLLETPGDDKATQALERIKAALKDEKESESITNQFDTALDALRQPEAAEPDSPCQR